MVGLTADMKRSGMEKGQMDEIYKTVSRSTYGNAPESTEDKTTTSNAP